MNRKNPNMISIDEIGNQYNFDSSQSDLRKKKMDIARDSFKYPYQSIFDNPNTFNTTDATPRVNLNLSSKPFQKTSKINPDMVNSYDITKVYKQQKTNDEINKIIQAQRALNNQNPSLAELILDRKLTKDEMTYNKINIKDEDKK